jgi:hypothetical protein
MKKEEWIILTTAFTGMSWTKVSSNTFLRSAFFVLLRLEKLLSSGLLYSENFLLIRLT